MTDITELLKKHGVTYDRNINGDTVLFMTHDQLRAIIKEASAPLVEVVKENIEPLRYTSREFGSITQFNAQRYIYKQIKANLKALAEFNKEFGDD